MPFSFYLIIGMILILLGIYVCIYILYILVVILYIVIIVYRRKREERGKWAPKTPFTSFLNDYIFSFSLIIIMYNIETLEEIERERAMEMKQSLVCVVADCHYCSPQFKALRPRRELTLLTFMEHIDMHGMP